MKTDFLLTDKVIIITGATGVLGGAFADGITQAGATVGILGRNGQIANERTQKIINKGGKAIALIADVTKESDLIAARDLVLSTYGRIDGLVNAAGGNMPDAVVQPDQDIFKLT